MNELRQNLVSKRWVIIATDRAKRPNELIPDEITTPQDLPAWDANCPFCPGNEELDLEVMRSPAEGPWNVRVVRNLYPAVSTEGERLRHYTGVRRHISAVGYHEILVETPLHNTCQALEGPAHLLRLLNTFQQRGQTIGRDQRIEQIVYFKNHGHRAGASLLHPHAQIIGLPIVPSDTRVRTEEMRRYFDDTGRCAMCTMLEQERADGVRVVVAGERFTAFVPYAASSPFHMWIVPHRHEAHFPNASSAELDDLSRVFHRVLRKLFVGVNNPDFNFIIRSAPVSEGNSDYQHWYVTIVPRLTRAAGLELGAAVFINPTIPEECAAFLRAVEVD